MTTRRPATKRRTTKRPAKRPLVKPWAVLVYMVTDSAEDPSPGRPLLDTIAEQDALLIAKALRPHARRIHVAIQADLKASSGTYRWVLGRDPEFRKESRATSTRALNEFFEWGRANCPARRYAVLFWGHSEGPMGLFSDSDPGKSDSADALSLKELSAGLRHMSVKLLNKRPIDVVLFKNCFQAILETGFEVRDSVRYVIASQALIPSSGWPYPELLASFTAARTATIVRQLVHALGQFYADQHNRGDHPVVPFSLLDLEALDAVASPLKALVTALVAAKGISAEIHHACERAWLHNECAPDAVTPGDVLLVDIRTLCQELTKLGAPVVSRLADGLRRTIDRLVVGLQPASSAFRGVSVYYVPASAKRLGQSLIGPLLSRSAYEDLVCSRKTHWAKIALENSA